MPNVQKIVNNPVQPSPTAISGFGTNNNTWLPGQVAPDMDVYVGATQANDNFAAWLFDSPNSQEQDFESWANLPFVDFGMNYSPANIWEYDFHGPTLLPTQEPSAPFFNDITPLDQHIRIQEHRRDRIVTMIASFYVKKRPPNMQENQRETSVLYNLAGQTFPNVTAKVLENCMSTFWRDLSPQMPIIHQPTFSASESNMLLLLAMIALGASQIVRLQAKGVCRDYQELADLIATSLRWEILTDDEAQPPVHLWVAQSLLLLELYEKMYTTRQLHERAHIHHTSTLTLLRRGSPLVGNDTDSSSQMPTRCTTPDPGTNSTRRPREPDSVEWWRHWVRSESMRRVVFSAFAMDALHAVSFGHEAGLFPYEVRVQLPCDDALWNARSPEEVQRLEATFSMHGIKPINFLDGLKRCLHGQDVPSHQHARLILVAGLLSVGWHIHRREKSLHFLETIPSPSEQSRWRSLLLNAYDHWRRSFEDALGPKKNEERFADPSVLFRLANITTYVDNLDLQIFAGSKRLLGRKVSDRDYAAVVQRQKAWAGQPTARIAVLHAFKLLFETFVHNPNCLENPGGLHPKEYSCRADPCLYRPWMLYLAGLTIWAYQHASHLRSGSLVRQLPSTDPATLPIVACQYILSCASSDNPEELLMTATSDEGCAAVMKLLADDFALAESELLLEASKRLQECGKMLMCTTT
jgi:hypothetical protein